MVKESWRVALSKARARRSDHSSHAYSVGVGVGRAGGGLGEPTIYVVVGGGRRGRPLRAPISQRQGREGSDREGGEKQPHKKVAQRETTTTTTRKKSLPLKSEERERGISSPPHVYHTDSQSSFVKEKDFERSQPSKKNLHKEEEEGKQA